MEGALGERRRELVAAAGADRGAAGEGERHVGAELAGQVEHLVARQLGAPQGVAGEQRGRGIRRSAAHPAGDRHVLLDLDVGAARVPGARRQQAGGLDGDVGRRRSAPGESSTVPRHLHREVVGLRRPAPLRRARRPGRRSRRRGSRRRRAMPTLRNTLILPGALACTARGVAGDDHSSTLARLRGGSATAARSRRRATRAGSPRR